MIVIYGKDNCPQCVQAVQLCEQRGLGFKYLKLDTDYTREELIEKCPVPVRTVPQIFVDDVHLGGVAELRNANT